MTRGGVAAARTGARRSASQAAHPLPHPAQVVRAQIGAGGEAEAIPEERLGHAAGPRLPRRGRRAARGMGFQTGRASIPGTDQLPGDDESPTVKVGP